MGTISTEKVLWLAGSAIAVIAVAYIVVFGFPGTQQAADPAPQVQVPVTAEATARAFADAYASGDTPTACALTADQAHGTLDQQGLCTNKAPWATGAYLHRSCELPARRGGTSYEFALHEGQVNGFNGFDVVVTGSDQTWRVTSLLAHTGESLCDIYNG